MERRGKSERGEDEPSTETECDSIGIAYLGVDLSILDEPFGLEFFRFRVVFLVLEHAVLILQTATVNVSFDLTTERTITMGLTGITTVPL